MEEVQSGWEKKEQERACEQRILDMTEKVLQAQNRWTGAGRFILRKVSDVSNNIVYQLFVNFSFDLYTPISVMKQQMPYKHIGLGTGNIATHLPHPTYNI